MLFVLGTKKWNFSFVFFGVCNVIGKRYTIIDLTEVMSSTKHIPDVNFNLTIILLLSYMYVCPLRLIVCNASKTKAKSNKLLAIHSYAHQVIMCLLELYFIFYLIFLVFYISHPKISILGHEYLSEYVYPSSEFSR